MRINRGYSQRGAFLILVAFLLPLIMAMLGFVIDFGNVYWHKSVLQNCADASALGGAKIGDEGNKFNKSKADSMADKLLAKNKRYDSKKKSYQYLGSKSDPKNTHYYVVTLTEKVPMFFLKYFGYKEMEIDASCIVKVHKDGGGSLPLFDNLITYSKRLYVVNSELKTFKGNIIHTKSDAKAEVQGYRDSSGNIVGDYSKGLLNTPNGPILPNDTSYYKTEYAVGLDEPQNKALKEYIDGLRKNTAQTPMVNTQTVTTELLKNTVTYIYDSDSNKRRVSEVNIDKDFDKNPNNTHVLIITDGAVNLKFNSDVTCKLFIINLSSEQFAISGGGKVHATIYAPNATSVVWNPSNLDFYGSIAAPNIEIQASTRSFTHESPNISSGTSSSKSSMSLADDEDIAW